jgi:hypothetical protein
MSGQSGLLPTAWAGRSGRPSGRVRRWLPLLLVALLLGACGAQPRDRFLPPDTTVDPYAAVRAQADEYYRQGQEYYRKGEYRRALDSFQRAKLHDPNPRPEVEEMIRRTQEALANAASAPLSTVVPAASASATPVPSPPSPTPVAGLTFVSRVYSYSLVYPTGWRAEGASNRVGSTLLDLYTEEGDGGATALVFGFTPPDGASQEALIRQSLAIRQKMGTPYKRLGVRPVDDAQAIVVTYTEQRADGVWLAVRQAVFQRGGTCWVVAVAAPATDAQRYGGVLDKMLDSFRVNPTARL